MTNKIKAIETAAAHAIKFIHGQAEYPAGIVIDPQAIRASFVQKLQEQPMDAELVVEELAQSAEDGLLGSTGGRFLAGS